MEQFVYVINLGNNSANVIATASNTLLSTPQLNNIFNVPQSLAITPNGEFVYVASAGDGSVVVIETATNTVYQHQISFLHSIILNR